MERGGRSLSGRCSSGRSSKVMLQMRRLKGSEADREEVGEKAAESRTAYVISKRCSSRSLNPIHQLQLHLTRMLLRVYRTTLGKSVVKLQYELQPTYIRRCYKSQLNLPSKHDFSEAREWMSKFQLDIIPKRICEVSFSRSSGPGGQNVNKYGVTSICIASKALTLVQGKHEGFSAR